jgi:hypothetical protein
MALAGLAAALRDLPERKPAAAPEDVTILTTSAELAGFAPFLARLGAGKPSDGPADDLDLWAQISRAAQGRRLSLTRRPLEPRTALAFAAAWAELARDKARASGPFASPIPRSNLAKMPGPDQD